MSVNVHCKDECILGSVPRYLLFPLVLIDDGEVVVYGV